MRSLRWLILILGFWVVWLWAGTAHGPLTLAWDAVTNVPIASYNLRWGTASGQQTGGINVTSGVACVANACQMTVKGLDPQQQFFFVVTAVGTDGQEGPISNEATGRPSLVPHQ